MFKLIPKYIVLLRGGIGNQLFQYAYAKYLKSVKHENVVVYYHLPGDPYNRSDIIKHIDPSIYVSDNIIGRSVINIIEDPNKEPPKLIRWLSRILKTPLPKKRVYHEECYSYDTEFDKREGAILEGYWQSAEMVNSVKDEIKETLLKNKISSKDYIKIQGIISEKSNPVAIHIRCFKDSPGHTQQTLDKSYYKNAINKLLELNKDSFFFIFTDDNPKSYNLIKDIMSKYEYLLVPNLGTTFSDYESLLLMSQCRSFIMSNSTFCWWGAWLSWANSHESNDATYLMPNRWDINDQDGKVTESFKFSHQCFLIDT